MFFRFGGLSRLFSTWPLSTEVADLRKSYSWQSKSAFRLSQSLLLLFLLVGLAWISLFWHFFLLLAAVFPALLAQSLSGILRGLLIWCWLRLIVHWLDLVWGFTALRWLFIRTRSAWIRCCSLFFCQRRIVVRFGRFSTLIGQLFWKLPAIFVLPSASISERRLPIWSHKWCRCRWPPS